MELADKNIKGNEVVLREVLESDLPIYFEQQRDPEAVFMAAFTAENPDDRAAFEAHLAKIRADATVTIRTIMYGGQVAGSVLSHSGFGVPEVSYWLGKAFWGKGIATRALELFLEIDRRRPMYGRAVKDNLGSIRVLEKCGFEVEKEEMGYANARGEEVAEVVMVKR